MAVELAEAYVALVPSFKGGTGAIARQMGGPAQAAGASAGGLFSGGFVKSLKRYKGLIASGLVGSIGGGILAVGKTFDKVSDTIRVGTGATGKALDGLVQSARNVGKDVPSNFGDIGTAVADLNTRLGLTGKPLEDIAGQFLNLSRITGTDLSANIAGITRVFGDWGIATEDQSGALDQIYRASQATGAGIDSLSNNVVKFGGPMRQLGFSFTDTLALLGKFDKEGVNTELVMGSMRIALGKMAREGEEPVKTLARVTEQIKNSGDAGKANALALELFGARAGPDMAAAIREGRFEIDDLATAIASGSDTINDASKDTASFGESWQLFKNRALLVIEPIAKRVFDALGRGMEWVNTVGVPAFTAFASTVQDKARPALDAVGKIVTETVWPALKDVGGFVKDTLIPGLSGMAGWLKQNQAWLAPIAVGIGAIVAALKLYAVGIAIVSAATKAWAAIQAVLNLVLNANPIGLVVLALVGLAAGLVYAWKTSETFRNVVKGVFEAVWNAIKFVWDWTKANWPLLLAILAGPIGLAVYAIIKNWDKLKGGLAAGWRWIKENAINPLVAGFQRIWDKADDVKDGVVGAFGKVAEAVSGVFSGVTTAIKRALNWVFKTINRWMIRPLNKVIALFGIPEIPDIPLIKMHKGGLVDGTGEQPRMLLGGESVLNTKATKAIGPEVINALNRGEGFGGPLDGWSWDSLKRGAKGAARSFGAPTSPGDVGDLLGLFGHSGPARGAKVAARAVVEAAISKIASIPGSPKIPNQPPRQAMLGVGNTVLGWIDGAKKDLTKQVGPGGTFFPLPAGSYRVGVGINGYPGHTGQDFPAPTGTPVFSPINGFFTGVNLGNRSYGRYADVRSGGLRFIGAHLSALVGASRFVQVGDLIGRVGSTGNSTGPHLHAEFQEGGIVQDPRRYLKFDAGHGVLPTGHSLVYNGTGGPEPLVDPRRMGGGVTLQTFGTRADMVNDIRWALQVEANMHQAVSV